MAFTVEDFRDLVRLLEERPEWKADLRRLVLSEELLALPESVERRFKELIELVAAGQAETDRRFAQTDRQIGVRLRVHGLLKRAGPTYKYT